MLKLFDTHCHINDERFQSDRAEVIARMREAGIRRAVVVGDGARSPSDAFALARENDFLYAAAGVHPHDASLWTDAHPRLIREWMAMDKVVALGEIGLDYHYDLSPRSVQKEVFDRQLDLAYELDKPVILHIRDAHGDTIDLLRAHKNRLPRCVVHCCSASWESAKVYLNLGCMISFAGPVTLKRSVHLHEVAVNMPLDRLMIETDSPYLSPVPMRGKRNDSRNLKYIAEKIAEVKGCAAEDIACAAYENGRRLFEI